MDLLPSVWFGDGTSASLESDGGEVVRGGDHENSKTDFEINFEIFFEKIVLQLGVK